jgi:hypothetical protein
MVKTPNSQVIDGGMNAALMKEIHQSIIQTSKKFIPTRKEILENQFIRQHFLFRKQEFEANYYLS